MEIKRIDPLSAGKVIGAIYAGLGLLFGAIFSLMSVVGFAVGGADAGGPGVVGLFMGAGAIIVLPIVYGILGGLMVALSAVLYNLAAGVVGGIRVELSAPEAGTERVAS